MRIGINTRLLLENKLEGIGWFTFETLKRICINHPEHEFYFFFDRKYSDQFIFSDNITPVVLFPQARHPFLYYLYFEFAIPRALKKYKIDCFVSPDGFIPQHPNIPTLAVIHDITFEHRPQDVPLLTRLYYRYFFPIFAKSATRIATVSNFSKQDLVNTYKVPSEKIDVVFNGANEKYAPLTEDEINSVKKKYSESKDYFIYVGSLNPRKNIKNLLLAFDHFKKETKSDIKLLLVGSVMHSDKHFKTTYESLSYKNEIIFCGRLSNEDLHRVIGASLAMTYIPFYEGFGIPVLEAIYCHVPVITSNVSSLPEVAGDAALYVNPNAIEEIAAAMKKISADSYLREELVRKSIIRKVMFTWNTSAELLWNAIEKTMLPTFKK